MKKRGVDHSMLLSNKQLLLLIRNPVKTLEELEEKKLMSSWKVKNYGPSLLKALGSEPYEDLISSLHPIKKKVKVESKPSKNNW